jgi:hypothetical protein
MGGEGVTQFGRALSELNIDIICANSPQANSRVERAFYAAGPAGQGAAACGDIDGCRGERVVARARGERSPHASMACYIS